MACKANQNKYALHVLKHVLSLIICPTYAHLVLYGIAKLLLAHLECHYSCHSSNSTYAIVFLDFPEPIIFLGISFELLFIIIWCLFTYSESLIATYTYTHRSLLFVCHKYYYCCNYQRLSSMIVHSIVSAALVAGC